MIQNAVFLPICGEYRISTHRHDFVAFKLDGSKVNKGDSYFFIDGGLDYCRTNFVNHPSIVSMNIEDNADEDTIYNKLLWGSKGKSGKEPVKYSLLKDLEIDHLRAILATQHHIDPICRQVITRALLERT